MHVAPPVQVCRAEPDVATTVARGSYQRWPRFPLRAVASLPILRRPPNNRRRS